jgi:hypothetical protein
VSTPSWFLDNNPAITPCELACAINDPRDAPPPGTQRESLPRKPRQEFLLYYSLGLLLCLRIALLVLQTPNKSVSDKERLPAAQVPCLAHTVPWPAGSFAEATTQGSWQDIFGQVAAQQAKPKPTVRPP